MSTPENLDEIALDCCLDAARLASAWRLGMLRNEKRENILKTLREKLEIAAAAVHDCEKISGQ
jgi:hypothetical protein